MLERLAGSGWGRVLIEAPSMSFALGSDIEGTITVQAKQDLGPCSLTVAAVCVRRQARTIPPVFNRRVTHQRQSNEVWRSVSELETELSLVAGEEFTTPFQLALPSSQDKHDDNEPLPDWARGTIAVFETVTFARDELQWQLRARLRHDAGWDLRSHRPLLVES